MLGKSFKSRVSSIAVAALLSSLFAIVTSSTAQAVVSYQAWDSGNIGLTMDDYNDDWQAELVAGLPVNVNSVKITVTDSGDDAYLISPGSITPDGVPTVLTALGPVANATTQVAGGSVASGLNQVALPNGGTVTYVFPAGLTQRPTFVIDHDGIGWDSYSVQVSYVHTEPSITRIIKSSDGTSAQVFFTEPTSSLPLVPVVTDYKYNLGLGGGWQSLEVADATSPITIPNLARNVGYNLQLRAVNVNGDGIASTPAIFSVEPQDDQFTIATATSAVATDAAATASINFTAIAGSQYNAVTLTPVLVSGPATNTKWGRDISYTAGSTVNLQANEVDADTGIVTIDPLNTGRFTYPATASFTPTVAGTYVFRFTASGAVNNQSFTWTITATNPAVAASTAFISTTTGAQPTADGTSLASPAVSQVDARAILTVRQYASATEAAVAAAAGARIANKWASAVTVAISGAGSVGLTSNATARYSSISVPAATAAAADFYVFSDGRSGTATITVTVGTTVLTTKSFVFHGVAATITPTVVNSVIPASAAGAALGAITAVVSDANGNPVSGATVYDVSSATGVISDSYSQCSGTGAAGVTAADGKVTCNLTGVAAGTANITLTTNASATATSGVTSAPVSIRVGSAPATATVTFDKASYQAGERATITVALRDAAGLAVPNALYAGIFTAALTSTSVISAGNLPTADITTTGSTGNATFTINMPLVAGTVSVTGTGSTGLPTAAQVAISGSAVVDPSPELLAATDAAAEAIDAANAATDAANLAAEAADAATVAAEEARDAADAATAAIEELATQVATLMAALKAQLTTLANTVAKIAKKVKA